MKNRGEEGPHEPPAFIDLFAGCGGLSLGLMSSGWRGLFAIEKERFAFATLRHNLIETQAGPKFDWPSWLPKEPMSVQVLLRRHGPSLTALQGKVDLVSAGLPCQGFSLAGERNEKDPRNRLFRHLLDVLDLVQPPAVLIENVPGITARFGASGNGPLPKKRGGRPRLRYSERIGNALRRRGYIVWERGIRAQDFGVPQLRKRHLIIALPPSKMTRGSPFDLLYQIRPAFLAAHGLSTDRPVTAREAIGDLLRANDVRYDPEFPRFEFGTSSGASTGYQKLMAKGSAGPPDSHRFTNHTPEVVDRFRKIIASCPPGKNIPKATLDDLGTSKITIAFMSAEKPSRTITTIPDDLIHYSEPRTLTVRESARIQSFPDAFQFKGKYTTGGLLRKKECPRFTQVANAVPPLLAEAIGTSLAVLLTGAAPARTAPLFVEPRLPPSRLEISASGRGLMVVQGKSEYGRR